MQAHVSDRQQELAAYENAIQQYSQRLAELDDEVERLAAQIIEVEESIDTKTTEQARCVWLSLSFALPLPVTLWVESMEIILQTKCGPNFSLTMCVWENVCVCVCSRGACRKRAQDNGWVVSPSGWEWS